MAEIEDGSVRSDLGLASTTYALLRRLEENPVVREARERVYSRASDVLHLLERAVRMYESPAPEGYAHPDDLALTAYLFILARIQTPGIQRFISRVAKEAKREFFAATGIAAYFAKRVPLTTVVAT